MSGSSIELDRHGDIKLDLKLSDDAEELAASSSSTTRAFRQLRLVPISFLFAKGL